jgi:hypothetical protein
MTTRPTTTRRDVLQVMFWQLGIDLLETRLPIPESARAACCVNTSPPQES